MVKRIDTNAQIAFENFKEEIGQEISILSHKKKTHNRKDLSKNYSNEAYTHLGRS